MRSGACGDAGAAGFTLVELVAVLVIVGILSIFALPRFADVDVFERRGYFEEALAGVRYAQKLAVGSGCSIRVEFDAGAERFEIARWTGGAACTDRVAPLQIVARPGSDSEFASTAPSGVDVANSLAFYFDRVGRPHDLGGQLITNPANLRVDIGGRRLQVTPDTGLVRAN